MTSATLPVQTLASPADAAAGTADQGTLAGLFTDFHLFSISLSDVLGALGLLVLCLLAIKVLLRIVERSFDKLHIDHSLRAFVLGRQAAAVFCRAAHRGRLSLGHPGHVAHRHAQRGRPGGVARRAGRADQSGGRRAAADHKALCGGRLCGGGGRRRHGGRDRPVLHPPDHARQQGHRQHAQRRDFDAARFKTTTPTPPAAWS